MSDIVVKLIPPDPQRVPGDPERALALALLRQRLPQADAIGETVTADVRFVDAGENFHEIFCPACGRHVELDEWQEAMSKGQSTMFEELVTELSCCKARVSLNDLRYDWPQGFARWRVELRNPGMSREEFDVVAAELERLLGFKPRVVWALA
jgi:hypothetical protein